LADKGGLVQTIPIPAVNEYPLKDIRRWAKKAYRKARIQVGWRKAQKIKEMMPIEMADYAVKKTFGNWRLVAPTNDNEISPLATVIRYLRPLIDHPLPNPLPSEGEGRVRGKWGKFRRKFVRLLKLAFNAICDSDYDEKMVCQMNEWINQLVGSYCHCEESRQRAGRRSNPDEIATWRCGATRNDTSCQFVLLPETAEDYSSERFLEIRSRIWERFTGRGLELTRDSQPTVGGRQMEMYLSLSTKEATDCMVATPPERRPASPGGG